MLKKINPILFLIINALVILCNSVEKTKKNLYAVHTINKVTFKASNIELNDWKKLKSLQTI